MIEFISASDSSKSNNSAQFHHSNAARQRLSCSVCNYQLDPNSKSAFKTFSCNVRAFKEESFKVWRCPDCSTIHCLDVVDLPHYYAQYPFAQSTLNFLLKLCYRNLRQQLTKHGFSHSDSLLDYGCGSGLFLEYLQQCGFTNCHGYDPYGSPDRFGNVDTLQTGPFNYIVLQDVIEHVEHPYALLNRINTLLAPGGHVLIGTPNAANINLNSPHVSDHYNPVHVPYHLHLYTPESIELLGYQQGWELVDFYDRPYHDTLMFGVNARTWNQYQRLMDGTINVIFEPINFWKALTSPRFIFYSVFGYWLSLKTEMSIMFRKTGA